MSVLLSLTSWCGDIPLNQADLYIGRSDSCDRVINLPHISSKHCRIVTTPDGRTQIQDLSSNGTFVDGRRLVALRFEEICNGDTISLTPPGERTVEAVGFVFTARTAAVSANLVSQGLHNFDLQIVKQLGKGSFGEVYLGVKNHSKYAVKVVKKSKQQTDSKLFEEVRVMERLKYPHIVQIQQVWDSPDRIIISLEFASGGDLEHLLQAYTKFGETDAKSIIVQVLNALEYLHDNRVIHRDLKPENVLLKHPIADQAKIPHLLLTDFGMSRMFDHHNKTLRALTICGTPNYVACEVVHSTIGYDEKVDLWSAGVLLYRVLNGCLPWKRSTTCSLTDQILRAGNVKTPVEMACPDLTSTCKQFIRALIVGPEHRLSAHRAIRHEWIAGTRKQLAIPASMDEATQNLYGEEEEEEDSGGEEEEENGRRKRMRSE
ncbi:hypothetical protein BASA81_011032 [Batrachochytrium salamandrivorans]|nr:hypothetical protein BASA81_011032 [Batrachochytrium salamandrivorans]